MPVRPAEVEGRRGKQPDGSAKTREVKLSKYPHYPMPLRHSRSTLGFMTPELIAVVLTGAAVLLGVWRIQAHYETRNDSAHFELSRGHRSAAHPMSRATPEARKCIHYVFGNRHRMRYPQFRARGLCVSSGVVAKVAADVAYLRGRQDERDRQ